MLNMRAFPSAFNITLEVHTIQEARQAVRLWSLLADVLILIWKGSTISNRVMCPVPMSFTTAGGGGYFAFLSNEVPSAPKEVTGLSRWNSRKPEEGNVVIIGTRYASLLPSEVGRFLAEEAVDLVSLGRLVVVPATGIGCIGVGHGPLDSLFAEACNAVPAIKGDALRAPVSWVPYFPDIPLHTLADITQEHQIPLRRLRLLLLRKTRSFYCSGVSGTESKELELEIEDSLAEITDTHDSLRRKYGWGEARESVATRYDGFNEDSLVPILVLQNMGYRWRVENAIGAPVSQRETFPREDEPICTWLHPADTHVNVVDGEKLREMRRRERKQRANHRPKTR